MKKKRNIHLVSDSKTKKKYNKFFVIMADESIYEFDLKEWKVYREEEWVEVSKIDGSEMDCFSIGNIMRVRFVNTTKKESTTSVVSLKPVPPTAA